MSWEGDTSTVDVKLKNCWKNGAVDAAGILRRNALFKFNDVDFAAIAQSGACNMLRPKGRQVGVLR